MFETLQPTKPRHDQSHWNDTRRSKNEISVEVSDTSLCKGLYVWETRREQLQGWSSALWEITEEKAEAWQLLASLVSVVFIPPPGRCLRVPLVVKRVCAHTRCTDTHWEEFTDKLCERCVCWTSGVKGQGHPQITSSEIKWKVSLRLSWISLSLLSWQTCSQLFEFMSSVKVCWKKISNNVKNRVWSFYLKPIREVIASQHRHKAFFQFISWLKYRKNVKNVKFKNWTKS